jgi:predicted nucleic acid-binding Zn ribbon protein
MSDPPLTTCETCKGSVHRIVSASGLIFKGSGFYINDYARKKKDGASETKGGEKKASPSGEKQKKETSAKPKPKE